MYTHDPSVTIAGMDDAWKENLLACLNDALERRSINLYEEPHREAVRLFNGFSEGYPGLSAELYAQTLVLFLHKVTGAEARALAGAALEFYRDRLPFLCCAIAKQRSSPDAELKRGSIIYGDQPDEQIVENGVSYALDLRLNQDASFYIDTRNVRAWLKEHSAGLDVLNTFAYTGSLGVAALAGGARRVVQIDRNKHFLELAGRSAALNRLDLGKLHAIGVDFFVGVGQMRNRHEEFDLVVLDPPFFSITERGRVDQVNETARLVNKVRPLVRDGGRIVAINNALFLSGEDYLAVLQDLCESGSLSQEDTISVPPDAAGFALPGMRAWPADPVPFNHPTKIAVLGVKRKNS